MKVREIKKFPNGAQEVVYCDLIYREPGIMVLRFLHTEDPYAAAAVVTEIIFWEGRDYLLYKLFDIQGGFRGYRIDICSELTFAEDSVQRMDLGLQLLVDTMGAAFFLGEDTVAGYEAMGLLSPNSRDTVKLAREFLIENYNSVIHEGEEIRRRAAGPGEAGL